MTRKKVVLTPTWAELGETQFGLLLTLQYTAPSRPCQLFSILLHGNNWSLNEITINRRYLVWGTNAWSCGLVLTPGDLLEVKIQNNGWTYDLARPEVDLVFEYLSTGDVLTPRPPTNAEEMKQKILKLTNANDKAGAVAGTFITKIRKKPDPGPPPTRFSELDLEDDE